ncbi:MAG: ATP-binding protein [Spirochaetaceae bacterium]
MRGYFSFLRNIPFFKNLSDDDIRQIMKYCRETEYTSGNIVFNEGDRADRFYIVMSGEVEVWKDYESSEADMLAVHGEGKLFGEMALVDDLPRSATVVSRTDTRMLFINDEEFQRLLEENSHIALSIVRSLSAMVRKSNETFLEDLRERNLRLQRAYDQLKEAQAELLRNERLGTLGKFSSMILHDIRNPLSVIRAFADLLKSSGNLQDKEKKYVDNIRFETQNLNQLANELLDYSRGEIRLDIEAIAIPALMEEVCEFARRRMSLRNIEIECTTDYDGRAMIDRQRIYRVLTNLIENSRKALKSEGKCTVSVTKKGKMLAFSVEDTGIGIEPKVLERIYEPFYSASKGGTGLGLAIVKSTIEAHGGDIDISSTPGEGTRVTFSIPLHV